jgi:hypothetical protein
MEDLTMVSARALFALVALFFACGISAGQRWGAMPAVEGMGATAAADAVKAKVPTVKVIFLGRDFNEVQSTEKSVVAWQYPAAGAVIEDLETVALVVEYQPLKAKIVSDAAIRPKILGNWLGYDPKSINWPRKSCRLIYSMTQLTPAQINSGAYRVIGTYPAPYDPVDPASVVGAIVVPMEILVPPVTGLQPLYWPTVWDWALIGLGLVNFFAVVVITRRLKTRSAT